MNPESVPSTPRPDAIDGGVGDVGRGNQIDGEVGRGADAHVSLPLPSAMPRHRFDPVSASLGIAACLAGAVTITGVTDPLGARDAGVGVAAAALVIGLVMLPWGRRRSAP